MNKRIGLTVVVALTWRRSQACGRPPALTCPATICPITDTESQMFPSSSATQAFTITLNAGPTPVFLDNLLTAGNTAITTFPGVRSITSTYISAGLSATDPLLDMSIRVGESAVPEPADPWC